MCVCVRVSFTKSGASLSSGELAEVWFQMSYRSRYSDRRSEKTEIDFSSPGLAVMEVEHLLFSGRAINAPANEVWPRLHIGDM